MRYAVMYLTLLLREGRLNWDSYMLYMKDLCTIQ